MVVVGRAADEVRAAVSPEAGAGFVEQKERLGTGHAVLQARVACGDGPGTLLVLPGDMPLLSDATLKRLVDHHVQTRRRRHPPDRRSAGRHRLRPRGARQGRPVGIVEHRDATPAQKGDPGDQHQRVLLRRRRASGPRWPGSPPDNEQGEYYLTDVIGILHRQGERLEAVIAGFERVPRGQRPQAARGAGRASCAGASSTG